MNHVHVEFAVKPGHLVGFSASILPGTHKAHLDWLRGVYQIVLTRENAQTLARALTSEIEGWGASPDDDMRQYAESG